MLAILERNIKWRRHNAVTILITLLQPLLWLALYGTAAAPTMAAGGIGDYPAFLLPGVAVLTSFSACSSGGMLNYRMKAEGSFARLLTAPVRRRDIVLGQVGEAVLCALLEAGLLVLAGVPLGVRPAAGPAAWAGAAGLLALATFFMAALAYGVSLRLPNEAVYETAMNAIVLPVFFLSSALFPAQRVSGALGAAVRWNPFTCLIDTLRALLLAGRAQPGQLAGTAALFLALDALGFGWALASLRRQTRR